MLMLIEIGQTNEEEDHYFLTLSIALGAQLIVLLTFSVLGFSFVFHDKAKRTQQGYLL